MTPRDERKLVLVLAAVQFVNILDFMMVMPLGPDFADDLGIPLSQLGIIGGSYTAAAAFSGLLGALFLDRFDRRPALALSLVGLAIGTAGGALATGLPSLVLARVVAGAFGGPATSLAMSILADAVPAERRGKALGSVMIAFSIASVLGVPVGLELARQGSWHTPFYITALLALLAAGAAFTQLPALRSHLDAPAESASMAFHHLLTDPTTLLSYAMTGVTMMGSFVLIPNIAAFIQENLDYPRDQLSWMYGAGGVVSFLTMRPIGRWVDRKGSFQVGTAGTVLSTIIVWVGFIDPTPTVPVLVVFMLFMLTNGMRNVAYNTLTSKVPRPEERARFMSLQSMVQHLGAAAGAFLSSRLLDVSPNGELVGMPEVAWTSLGILALVPFLLAMVESRVVHAMHPVLAAANASGPATATGGSIAPPHASE